ncbi:hypothetical protein LINGRAHAP2_LOCUS14885 [Linum grandiflorum]
MFWFHKCSKLNTFSKGTSCQQSWVTDQAMYGEVLMQPRRWLEMVVIGGSVMVILLKFLGNHG